MPSSYAEIDSSPLLGRLQAVWSILLAVVPLIYLFVAGCFLFVAPSHFLGRTFSCFGERDSDASYNHTFDGMQSMPDSILSTTHPQLSLAVRMARLVGSVLLGQVLCCISLIYPLVAEVEVLRSNSVSKLVGRRENLDKHRSAVASLCMIGLLVLVAGLLDDRTNFSNDNGYNVSSYLFENNDSDHLLLSCNTLQATVVIASGAVVLLFASASMMCSFWPRRNDSTTANDSPESTSASVPASRSWVRSINIPEGDAQVPLLSASGEAGNANDSQDDEANLETQPTEATNIHTGAAFDESNDESLSNQATDPVSGDAEVTSRIRGTTRLLKLAAPEVFYLYVGCVVLLIRLPFSLSIPHFISTTLGAVSRGDFVAARTEILLLFILGTIDAAFDFWCVFLFGYANQRIVRGVRVDTFLSILRQEVGFFDKTTSGELASRLNSDCGEMAGDLTWFFRFSIESIVRITGIVSYMLIRCPVLGLCAITIIPVVALVNKLYGNWLNKNAREVQDALAAANQVAQETFSCIRTVIAFASEQQEYKKYKEKIDHQFDLNIRQLYISGVYYMVISTFLINTVVQSTLLLVGTALIERGNLTGEILLAFMLYQGQLQSETMNLFQSYTSLVKSSGAGDKVFSLLDRSPAVPGTGSADVISSEIEEDADEVTQEQQGQQETALQIHSDKPHCCSVEFRSVHFTYQCRPDNQVLKSLNLNISQGETVALVGSSGCGKSTIVGLLQRFYDPTIGSILIDGEDLRTLDVKSHRRRIGVVTQNPTLFIGTILSNITYGCPGASIEDAVEAARLANALDFINSFPEGFNTDVGERGTRLSGGQMQRITIARAIIKKPSILLLDEATSALDAVSEQAVQDALDRLLKTNSHMTTIVVAHRLRTVRNADMIAFVENGQVAEIGTHEELLELPDGHYRKMVERAGNDGLLPES